LQTTTDSVEWVRSVSSQDGRSLSTGELGSSTKDVALVLLVGVEAREGIEETEVDSTVWDDTNNRHSDTVVQTTNTAGGHSLLQAIEKTVELLLSSSDIRSKTGTGVIERVDDAQRTGSSKTTSSHVNGEEFAELSVLVGLREEGLDSILEGEVEGLGREVPDDVGQVSTPESTNSLLLGDAGEAVGNALRTVGAAMVLVLYSEITAAFGSGN
jgi:hypothetical protein